MNETQQIKNKLDIVDFIREYIELKSAGSSFKGLCPFHNEKTPSFNVNREKGTWYCFGCAKGGDIFNFVQLIEGIEFVEALKLLAQKAGVELTEMKKDIHSSQRNRIKEINLTAARFYHNFLLKMDNAKDAREYLLKRGLHDETIEKWQIGYSPDQWELFTRYMLKKGFGIDDLVASGLTIQKENASKSSMKGFYDRFRGRIIFPIRDIHANVLGFTARILVETPNSGGKYINTPQTLVYDKSHIVFGLDKAKGAIREKDLIVVVEGQMDVISSHTIGVENVVAVSGTALTLDQVLLLKRYSTHLAMAFDSDAAGMKAAKRAIDIALQEGMNIKIITLPQTYKDPDECIKEDPLIWKNAIENAKEIMRWYFDITFFNRDLNNPKHKQEIANELLPEIAKIPHIIEQDHWLSELSSQLGIEKSLLQEEIKGIKTDKKQKEIQRSPTNLSLERQKTRLDALCEHILVLLLFSSDKEQWKSIEQSLDEYMEVSLYKNLYIYIKNMYNQNDFTPDNPELQSDFLALKAQAEFAIAEDIVIEEELSKSLTELKKEWIQYKKNEIQKQIEIAEKNKENETVMKLLESLSSLDK